MVLLVMMFIGGCAGSAGGGPKVVRHLLMASTSSVYGANTKLPFSVHDNVDHPISLYAATKKANELMAHTYAHLFALRVTGEPQALIEGDALLETYEASLGCGTLTT